MKNDATDNRIVISINVASFFKTSISHASDMSTLKGVGAWSTSIFDKNILDILKENNNIIEREKLIELDKIGERYDELYLDEKTADVHFLCESDLERIPAHKNILCEASDVFRTMFYGSMAQKGDIRLPETSSEAFKNFLKCCYFKLQSSRFDKLQDAIKVEVAAEVMYLGEMYMMPLCVKKSFDAWFYYICDIRNMDTVRKNVGKLDNIFFIFDFILLLEVEYYMFQYRLDIALCLHTKMVLKTSSFINCSHYALDHLLQLKELSGDESEIFGACLDWARHACEKNGMDPNDVKNIRHQLKDSVFKIRYGLMTMTEFERHIPKSHINALFPDPADCDDVIQLLLGSKISKTRHFNVKQREKFLFINY